MKNELTLVEELLVTDKVALVNVLSLNLYVFLFKFPLTIV